MTAERRLHPHLAEHREAGVATLRVDRQDALGALSRGMLERLHDYFTELHGDRDVRALVLTGTGRGFIAGADINEYHGVGRDAFEAYQRLGRATFDALAALPQATIAAVNGYALGGGFEVVLCCDLVVASDKARFGLPEIKLGLLPGGGGTQRLARAAGVRFAKELVLTGRLVPAEELYRRGLIGSVWEHGSLEDEARKLAEEIAANAPLAVRAAKRLIDDGVQTPLEPALTLEQQVLARLFASADAREGVAAFIDKRTPEFHGD
jgi:enoyl-CoA hydratase